MESVNVTSVTPPVRLKSVTPVFVGMGSSMGPKAVMMVMPSLSSVSMVSAAVKSVTPIVRLRQG